MHLGGIWEASGRNVKASGSHLGSIWQASGKNLEASGRHQGGIRRYPGASGRDLGDLGYLVPSGRSQLTKVEALSSRIHFR